MVLALVAAVSFALSLVITYVVPAVAFFSLPTRAWQLAAGGLVALTAGQWRRLPPSVAAITGWAGLARDPAGLHPFELVHPLPGYRRAVAHAGRRAGDRRRLRHTSRRDAAASWQSRRCERSGGSRTRGTCGTGRCWCSPLCCWATRSGLPPGWQRRLVSGGLAVLTLRFIENPLRFAAPIRRSAWASLALGGVATAVAVWVGVVLLQRVPVPVGRGPAAAPLTITAAPSHRRQLRRLRRGGATRLRPSANGGRRMRRAQSRTVEPQPAACQRGSRKQAYLLNGCLRTPFRSGQPECATGDTASATTVALVGDSHAAMWNPAFQQIATQRHWRLEMLGKGACPPMDLPVANHLRGLVEGVEHCEQWRGQMMARLRAEHPRLVVLSLWRGYGAGSGNGWLSGFTSYDPAWIDSLTRLVQQLRGTGAQVLVLGPVPAPDTVVPVCLSAHLDDATACSPLRSTAVNQPGIAAESAATKAGGGQYADLTELFCTADRCPVIVGNTLVYFDWEHLTLEYSRQLAPAIGALADRALASG